jgi:hypothetical protein
MYVNVVVTYNLSIAIKFKISVGREKSKSDASETDMRNGICWRSSTQGTSHSNNPLKQ